MADCPKWQIRISFPQELGYGLMALDFSFGLRNPEPPEQISKEKEVFGGRTCVTNIPG